MIGSTDGSVTRFIHRPREEVELQATDSINAPIVGAGDLVYLATKDGEIVALDSKTETRAGLQSRTVNRDRDAVGRNHLFGVAGGRVTRLPWIRKAALADSAPGVCRHPVDGRGSPDRCAVPRPRAPSRFCRAILEEWKASSRRARTRRSSFFRASRGWRSHCGSPMTKNNLAVGIAVRETKAPVSPQPCFCSVQRFIQPPIGLSR